MPTKNALRLRRGHGAWRCATASSTVRPPVSASAVPSRDLLGSDLTVEGVSFACAETHRSDSDGAVANYLNGATNVSTNGDAVDPVGIGDTFFDSTDFIGAFGYRELGVGVDLRRFRQQSHTAGLRLPGRYLRIDRATWPACGVCQLSNTITDDVLLTGNNLYELVGKVTIGGDNTDSATLTAQAGTTIFGGANEGLPGRLPGSVPGSSPTATRTAPVTLTAPCRPRRPDERQRQGAVGRPGDQRQRAHQRLPRRRLGRHGVDCTKEGEANSGLFGGDDADDSRAACSTTWS